MTECEDGEGIRRRWRMKEYEERRINWKNVKNKRMWRWRRIGRRWRMKEWEGIWITEKCKLETIKEIKESR